MRPAWPTRANAGVDAPGAADALANHTASRKHWETHITICEWKPPPMNKRWASQKRDRRKEVAWPI